MLGYVYSLTLNCFVYQVFCVKKFTFNCYGCHFTLQTTSAFSILYTKICLKRPLTKRPKMGLQDQLSLMQVKSGAECAFCNTFDLHLAISWL